MTYASGGRVLACLSAIREGRRWLDTKLVEHIRAHCTARADWRGIATVVRSENAYHVAEFFFVARELQLLRRSRVAQLLTRHNSDMDNLLADPERAWSMGLSPQRVAEARFSSNQREKFLGSSAGNPDEVLVLGQTDLSLLLAPLMAPESCRLIVLAMTRGGLLQRRKIARVVITSNGVLEDYFRKHLETIDKAIANGPGPTAE